MTIGEHLVKATSSSGRMMRMFETNFACHPDGYRDLPHEPDLQIHIEEGYGVPFVDYEVAITTGPDQVIFRRADYRLVTDAAYRTALISVWDALALKHALMNLYSSYIVHHGWGLLLHSSCVVEQGKAHIFAGPSGAGKSTVAKLSQPRELLSDEATLLKIAPDGIAVFNSPFRSELTATGKGRSAALASVQLLLQAPCNQRIRLNKSNGLLHLMDKVFFWAHDSEDVSTVFKFMHVLAGAVPIYELHFQNNDTFWELIS